MKETSLRRTKPVRVVEKALASTNGTTHAELAHAVLAAIHEAGWAVVPVRNPMNMTSRQRVIVFHEGTLTSRNLIEAAAEFDEFSDDERYAASDFVAWLLPEVKGTPEWLWLERRRSR